MKVNALIPIRYSDCVTIDGEDIHKINGQPLWEITLEQALGSSEVNHVVVAYDNPEFITKVRKYSSHLTLIERPPHLSLKGVTTLDVLGYVAKNISTTFCSDYWMLLEQSHPLRPQGIIDEMISMLRKQPADSLLTVYPAHYNFWVQQTSGIERMESAEENTELRVYQEMLGIGSLFKHANLLVGNPLGENIDMMPIKNFWATIDIRDDDTAWLAEAYLARKMAVKVTA
jgi:CMP-N-acetylneuraminic acid synthetase